jgi:hypothetical protein
VTVLDVGPATTAPSPSGVTTGPAPSWPAVPEYVADELAAAGFTSADVQANGAPAATIAAAAAAGIPRSVILGWEPFRIIAAVRLVDAGLPSAEAIWIAGDPSVTSWADAERYAPPRRRPVGC